MTHLLRLLAGSTALVAGMCYFSGATAAPPALSQSSFKKAADADLEFLLKRLDEMAAQDKPKDGFRKPAIASAVMLAMYGEALGDATLKADALKVAEALHKKDIKGATDLAKKLAIKPGSASKVALVKPENFAFDLDLVMNPFRAARAGGMNIEKDIRDMIAKKNALKVEPEAAEILGLRTAILGEYTFHLPNDAAATNKANTEDWQRWTKEMSDTSVKLTEEAGKGKTANEAAMIALLNKLNNTCSNCHNKFRQD